MVEAALPPQATQDVAHGEPIRSVELERLKARLAAPQGGVVVLHGPRGVGKTHLASDLARHVQAQGASALFEGRTPGAGASSFHPFAEIVRQAMSWAEQHGAFEALVDPLLGDLEPVLDSPERAGEPPSLDQKHRFFEGVRRLLAGVADRTRFLAVVHDLERADSDTLELASYLADNLFGDPALDPGNGRPGLLLLLLRRDRTTPDRARDFLSEAEERRSVESLPLDGLDLDGLRRYVQSPRLLEKLMAASEGLPRGIDELIDALPSNVEELFQRKLDALDPLAREVLSALALASQPVAARVLASVTGRPLTRIAHALGDLRDSRILERRIHNGELQFSFARRSNLEVTQRATSPEDLARLHGGWAGALAKEPVGAGGTALLAHHLLRSAEPSRGVPIAIRAAEAHTVAGAFDAAAQLLEDALPHARGELQLTILGRLSELASLRGQPRAAVRYVEQWKAALPASERGRALLREAELSNAAGEHDRALIVLDEARASLVAPLDRAQIEAAASEAHYQLAAHERARAAGRAGLALLDEAQDAPAGARIGLLNLLGKIALAGDDVSSALALFRETLVLSDKAGLPRDEARALVNLGLAHMRQGSLLEAELNLLGGIEKARETHDLSFLAFGNLNLGVLAHQRGELGRAIDRYRATKSLFRQLGNRTQLARVLYNLGALYLVTGDLARARAHNDEALRLARAGGVERLVAIATALDGILFGEEGDRAAAEARLREAMVQQRHLGAERPLETMVELAELQLRGGDSERASATLGEVEQGLSRVANKQLAARAKLLRGRILHLAHDPSGLKLLGEARDDIAGLTERLLLRDAELALGLAFAESGRRETARMHLGAALALQKAMAAELPEELRAVFTSARPQLEILEAFARLESPEPALRAEDARVPAEVPGAATKSSGPHADALKSSARLESAEPRSARHTEASHWATRYGAIIGHSQRLFRVFHILDRVAGSDGAVLISGESGTGKELIAEAIHGNSPRAKGPFVKLNCAALVESLLLSEFFGHERGSFTGAHQRKVGRFEMAAGGTIFLDEIGDISPKTQVALLRVLQEREFERVGGGRPIRLEARVLFATNRNLAQMVRDGTFREDLYYRLKGLTIELPPLRERPEDIAELAQHFLGRYALESGTPEKRLSAGAVEMLSRYTWPGNIRELENVVRSVALFADAQLIDRRDFDEYKDLFEDSPSFARAASLPQPPLPAPLPAARSIAPPPLLEEPRTPSHLHALPPAPAVSDATAPADAAVDVELDESDSALLEQIFQRGIPLAVLKRRIQDEAIAQALRSTRGNITRAAEMLGMKRPRLSQIINANDALKELCQGVGR